jgi:uncharacterized protein DUF6200
MQNTADPATTSASSTAAPDAGSAENEAPIILDFGRTSRERIKQLLRGRGGLMADVNVTIDELRARGVLTEAVRPVIVVVREKPESGWFS